MLRLAPKFHEVAKRIIEITQDCIVVAHNAVFDYRILRTEFRRLGYEFNSKNLCTVELAQRLLPEQPSHSLGKLVRALGIPMADRHRASGDALATVKLFKILLEKDTEKIILKELIKSEVEKGIVPKLQEIVDALPSKTGVYYIHNEKGSIIYVGKSRNIKKRVNQHFTGIKTISKKIQHEVFSVTYEETGSELIALLKECAEIKIIKPVYNHSQRKTIFNFSLYPIKDNQGYINLKIEKTDGRKREITSFSTLNDAKNALFRITSHYNLCQKLTGLYETSNQCFQYKIKESNGACIGKESSEEYNERVTEFIEKNSFTNENILLLDRGRRIDEHSAILIEKGIYKGYCFYDLNYQITNIPILKTILIPMQSNRDTINIIKNYMRKSKTFKIIKF